MSYRQETFTMALLIRDFNVIKFNPNKIWIEFYDW